MGPAGRRFRTSASTGGLVLLAATGCGDDLSVNPDLKVTIDSHKTDAGETTWPVTIPVHLGPGDTLGVDTLAVTLTAGGAGVQGMELEWESSAPHVLSVRELTSVAGSRDDSLRVQLRAEVVAHTRGTAVVRVRAAERPRVVPASFEDTITVKERWSDVSVGAGHACAIASDEFAYCWGRGERGQLGNGGFEGTEVGAPPTRVGADLRMKRISAGAGHSCGVDVDGGAWCWGWNVGGQLGDGTVVRRALPSRVESGGLWVDVQAGGSVSCGVSQDRGRVHCWGSALHGIEAALPAHDSMGLLSEPRTTPGICVDREQCLRTPEDVAGHTGEVGHSVMHVSEYWLYFAPLEGRTSVSVGGDHACAAGPDTTIYRNFDAPGLGRITGTSQIGSVQCWGLDAAHQSGAPPVLAREVAATETSAGPDSIYLHRACTPEDDSVRAPLTRCVRRATDVSGDYDFEQVSAGYDGQMQPSGFPTGRWDAHSCGLADGKIYCWGAGSFGQLGVPDSILASCQARGGSAVACSNTPTLVPASGRAWALVSAGYRRTCGLDEEGLAYCWGRRATRSMDGGPVPEAVPTDVRFRVLDLGSGTACGIRQEDDALFCWGDHLGTGFLVDDGVRRVPDPAPLPPPGGSAAMG